jgi:hypothetical protein
LSGFATFSGALFTASYIVTGLFPPPLEPTPGVPPNPGELSTEYCEAGDNSPNPVVVAGGKCWLARLLILLTISLTGLLCETRPAGSGEPEGGAEVALRGGVEGAEEVASEAARDEALTGERGSASLGGDGVGVELELVLDLSAAPSTEWPE